MKRTVLRAARDVDRDGPGRDDRVRRAVDVEVLVRGRARAAVERQIGLAPGVVGRPGPPIRPGEPHARSDRATARPVTEGEVQASYWMAITPYPRHDG